MSPSVGHTRRANIVGMVVGAWVMAHARSGSFDMVPRDYEAVERIYQACERVLASNSLLAIATINELFNAGLMPEPITTALAHITHAVRDEVDPVDDQPSQTRTMTDDELLRRRAALDRDLDSLLRKR